MVFLSALDFSLPLKNPVIIFSLVLFIILFAPILFNRIKVPHIIGLILAGVIVGPHGFNLLLRDSSIVLFGTVGLLYIMFTAGLEIDMEEFKKNRVKSFVFGLFTFLFPIAMGSVAAYYVLGFSIPSSILLGSMLSSHTLLAYPIVSKYGIARIRSVTMSIGGTIVTDILALLVLATVSGMTKGSLGPAFWIQLAVGSLIFGAIIFLLFPLIARWFFKKFEDHVAQYIFVLAMVFLGSFLAEVAGLEAIIGAFLSGLALNRFIPNVSALMNRIEFVGNAFFIPFFLISVGMLVDISVLFKGLGAIKVAGVMIVLAVLSKYIAAWVTQKSFKLSANERQMIFGLSNARVGATLAVVLVGYNIILAETDSGEPIRLLNEDVLNGAVLMILVTCTISSFIVEKVSKKMILDEDFSDKDRSTGDERILISLAYTETVTELVDLGLMLQPKNSKVPVFALHVTDDQKAEDNDNSGKKIMNQALMHAAATQNALVPLTRYDTDISNGIIYTIKEQNISDVLIGLHHDAGQDNFFGHKAEHILRRVLDTIYIYKPLQPFNTLKRLVVAVPAKAEAEPGFIHWTEKLTSIAKDSGIPIVYYASQATTKELKNIEARQTGSVKISYVDFNNWEDFLVLTGEVKTDDLFVIVSSRKGHDSYNPVIAKLPHYLTKYFAKNSYIILYPRQLESGINMGDIQQADSQLLDTISDQIEVIGETGKYVKRLFRRRSS